MVVMAAAAMLPTCSTTVTDAIPTPDESDE